MREPELEIRTVQSREDLRRALAIRDQVFTREQKIPAALDRDGHDKTAHHVLILAAGEAVATGRFHIEADGRGHLARIAVTASYRGRGLGARVVRELEKLARTTGVTTLFLEPHAYLEKFYSRLGYRILPGAASTAGDHHLICMSKNLLPSDNHSK